MKNGLPASASLRYLTKHPNGRLLIFYPFMSFDPAFPYKGSGNRLIGPNPSPDQTKNFFSELQVSSEISPVFLVQAGDDKTVPVENSIPIFTGLYTASGFG